MELLPKITQISIFIVGLIHVSLAIGEIFFGAWLLENRFDVPSDIATQADRIVKNAGIYNSFIAAGLFWAAFDPINSTILSIFFLSCVVIAGVFGAITLKWTTLIIQTIPAMIPLVLIGIGNK